MDLVRWGKICGQFSMILASLSRKAHFSFIGALAFAVIAAFFYWNGASEKEVESGVYRILNFENRQHTRGSTGTGFKVAEPGFVVTNYHVVRGARELFSQYQAEDGDIKSVAMRVVWQDKQQDIAVLRALSELPGSVLSLAQIHQDELHKKDDVEAIGYPGAADELAKVSANWSLSDASAAFADATVSTGTVQRQIPSATRLTIQHSANVNSGNSGGPLLDSCQRVIGVNTLSQVATLDLGNVARALKGDGIVRFQTPGALESSVHIREVLAALKEENIAPVTSSGRCRSGFTPSELWSFGLSSVASLAFFTLTGVALVGRGRRDYARGEGRATDFDEERYDEPNGAPVDYTVVADPADRSLGPTLVDVVSLKERKTNRSHDLSSFDALLETSGVTLGRRGGGADVELDDATVSRRHALVRRHHNGNLVVSDLGSTNGTWADGHVVSEDDARTLHDGTVLLLGSCELVLAIEQQEQALKPASSTFPDWLLSGFDASGKVFQFRIPGGVNSQAGQVGRAAGNDFRIDHPSISRQHAYFSIDASGRLLVRDLGSSNGTFIKGQRVLDTPVEIVSGSELQFGDLFATVSHIY